MGNCGSDKSNIEQPGKVNKVQQSPQQQQQQETPQNKTEQQARSEQPQLQQNSHDDVVTLGYWGVRGRAQPIRFLLEYVGLQYVDKKYTSRDEWEKDREVFLETNPLANIPYIKSGNEAIFESQALPIFVVTKAGKTELLPMNLKESVACSQAQGVVSDLFQAYFQSVLLRAFNKEKIPHAQQISNGVEALKPFFDKLEFLLNGKKFITGDAPKIVDFFIYESADLLNALDPATFKNYPNVEKSHSAFRALPPIQKYIESKRFQEKPFFTPGFSPV